MTSIQNELSAQCKKVKDIKGSNLIPMLTFIKNAVDKEPGFQKMKPKSLSTVLGKLNNAMKGSSKINICTKEGADQLQGKIVPEVMMFVPELKVNYDQHCKDYLDYLTTANGKKFLSGISQRIKQMPK